MDSLEIVIRVEDHFGITIKNAEGSRIRTVGDLVSLVHSRISAAHAVLCPTLPAFLKLRAALREMTGDPSLRIRPRQQIRDVLDARDRRQLWKRLPEWLDSPPRGLRLPRSLHQILVAINLALLGIALIAAIAIDIQIFPLTFLLALCAFIGLNILTEPFRTIPPDEWETFGDLARQFVMVTVATKKLQLRAEADVLRELRPLIMDVLGVDHAEVVVGARFVEDLGMD